MRRAFWLWSAVAGMALSGCGDSTTPARRLDIPPFLVVGDSGGVSHLYRVQDSVETQLSGGSWSDFDPNSAAGRVVYTSDRNGNFEVYITDSLTTVSRQVTNNSAEDRQSRTQSGRFDHRIREQSKRRTAPVERASTGAGCNDVRHARRHRDRVGDGDPGGSARLESGRIDPRLQLRALGYVPDLHGAGYGGKRNGADDRDWRRIQSGLECGWSNDLLLVRNRNRAPAANQEHRRKRG